MVSKLHNEKIQNSLNISALPAALSRFKGLLYCCVLMLLLLTYSACSETTPSGSTQADAAQILPSPPEQLKLYVFNGYIGNYRTDALMNLVFEADTITGSYYYFKNLGRLALNGKLNPVNNEVTLVESYKGKSTGYFKGQFSETSLIGKWSTNPAFDGAQEFALDVFKLSEVGTKPSATLTDGSYTFEHGVEMWNMEEEVFENSTSTDDLTVRFIDDTAFTFDYRTSGHNGHSGHIAGIGKMLNLNQGVFNGEENCELIFDFYDKKADIVASNCQYYGGQRASFGGNFTRK
ncbi:MAG: hypothetical protein AB8F78_18420 [Saprospiraceae bacterium]